VCQVTHDSISYFSYGLSQTIEETEAATFAENFVKVPQKGAFGVMFKQKYQNAQYLIEGFAWDGVIELKFFTSEVANQSFRKFSTLPSSSLTLGCAPN